MKRFYKFLMPLVAIVAMALPVSVMAQTTCTIKIVGEDGYGDGWNGGSLAIMQGTTTVATFNGAGFDEYEEGPELDSTTVTVQSGTPVSFVWTSGDYDDEVTIWIYDGGGSMVYTVTQPTAGTIYTMNTPCPSCLPPTGLAMDSTSGSIDISWTAGDGTAWQIVWGTGSFNPDTVTVNTADVSTNSYTLGTLAEGQYTVYVRTDCGDDTSAWASLHFCIGVEIMNMATSGTQTLTTCNAIIYDNGGPTGAYAASCQSTLIILPATAGDWVSISGSSYTESTYDYLTIYEGQGTTGEQLWTDNGIDVLTNFGPFASDAITVVFHSDGSVQRDGFQINATCVPGPSCLRPSSFSVTDVTPDSVYLAWVDTVGSEWLIVYGPAGFTIGDDSSHYETVTTNTAEIGDLIPNTNYDFYIMTLCSGDSSMTRQITVRTACDYIDSLPYIYGFEDAATGGSSTTSPFAAPCWVRLNNGTSSGGYPYISSSSTYCHTGSRGLCWYNSITTGSYGDYQCIVLPGLDVNQFPVNTLQLKFWAKASSTSYEPEFLVGVMTNPADINSFEQVAIVNVEGTTWTEYEAMLGTYTGTGRYVAIRANRPTSSWYAYFDDVTLEPMPECPHPMNLVVDSVSTEEIHVHWTALGTESSWLVTINDSIVTDAADTTYIFSNLSLNTAYTISVAALCSNGDTSAAISINTRTLAGLPISQFPYSCGFEVTDDGNEAVDWVLENQTNGWYVGTATSNGGTNGLYVSNDNGVSNTYSTGVTSVSYAYASFQLEAGEYAYSFDWKCQGESTYDFIRVAYAPYGTTLPTSYSSWSTGATAPSGFTALDGGKLNLQSNWQTKAGTFTVTNPGVYNLYFVWRNDGSSGTMPGGAIDNIQLVRNTCPAPRNLTATLVTSDSIAVTWNAGGQETSWQLVIGDSVPIDLTDSTYIFDELSPNTMYNIKVRGICGPEDTSMWTAINVSTDCGLLTALPFTEDFEGHATTSSSNNNFIPCWYKVNNATSTYYPYLSNTSSYNHTEGGSQGLYWYSTTTTSYGTYRMIVLPGVDTTVIPTNTTMLTFWAKPSGTSYDVVFYVGVMSDPTVDSTFQYYDTIVLPHSTTWAKYTVMFDNYVGEGNYIAIRDNTGSSYWYAYVDDITLDVIPDCPAVENLEIQAGPASAMVNWDVIGSDYTGAVVEYKADSVSDWTSITVTGDHYAAITGLDPETNYQVRVSAVCGDATGNAVSGQFITTAFGCAVMNLANSHFDTITGTSSTTSYQRPVNNFYRNTFSEQIYDSTELGAAGPIVAFSFKYAYNTPMTDKTNCQVYMANTTLSTISTSNYITPNNMTLVYSGSLNCVNGWNEFVTNTPFNYTGGNLAVAVIDNSGEYDGSAYVWSGHSVTGKSFSWYSDSYTYPNSSMSTNTDAFRPDMAFSFVDCIQQSTCAAPLPIVSDVTTNSVTLAWAPGNVETAWDVYYRQMGAANYNLAAANVATTTYQVTGLASGTNYEFMVVSVCSDSLSATVSVATECAMISSLPYTETFNSWGVGSGVMPNCWYRTGSYSSYTYISASQNHSGSTGGSIYMYQSGSNHSTIFMPALDTNTYQVNQTQLVFYVLNTSASYLHAGFEVGVLSDPNDITTFVPVDTVYHSVGPNAWQVFEVPLSNYTGNGAYIGLRTTDNPTSGTEYTYTYPYLDDFTLELIPTCPRPDSLTATNATTNSVDLSWLERGNATSWIIEYGPLGFELGTGTQVTATSNPFTLTGLPAAYQGEYYVRSVCSASDTGDYSRMSFAFNTSQIPATLPYNYDFENATEWANWQTSSNSATNNWYRGTAVADSGSYSMYMSTDAGATYTPYYFNAVVNAAAYRDVDFGPVDSSYTLSFRARVGGTTSAAYDGLMVFLVDPSLATVPSNANITSPWGNVNNLYRIATVRLDTTWTTYEASFDTIHGVHRVAFFWFNQNTGASYTNIPEAAAVDNIHIKYSACPRPVNLEAPVVGSTNATLTWDGEAGANYQVVYREVGSNNQLALATTNSITLTGLTSNATYRAWVRKLCGGGDTSLFSDGVEFMTTMCDGGTEALNFDPAASSTTSSYSPIGYATYNYSYVQTIIDSADLASLGGDITAFGFLPTNTTSSDYYTNMTMYMANVSESDLSSGFIMPSATHVFHKVIDSANFNFTTANEWQIHNLDSAFHWDGHSNLLIAVNREHGSWSSSTSFSAHTATASKMRYVYNDDNPYNYTTVSGGTSSSTVGDIRLISCGSTNVCLDPTIDTIIVGETTATLNWTGNASSYEVAVMANSWVEPTAPGTPVTGLTANVTGLTPGSQYYIGVRAVCGSALYSEWTVMNFTTLEHPCYAPTNVTATDVTLNSAVIAWTAGEEGQTDFQIRYSTAGDTTVVSCNTNPYTLTGLVNSTTYSVAVRAVCGEGNYSDWSAPYTFTTSDCDMVSNVHTGTVTSSSAVVMWSGSANAYEVAYGYQGTATDNCARATAAGSSYTLTGLEAGTSYDVYVRSVCAEGVYSEWSTVVTFATEEEIGIDDVEGANISLYPNPASSTVTLSGIEGQATVTVVDMNGREVYSGSVSDGRLTINVSDLSQGAYFVRIVGEQVNAIRKLIVR